MESERRGRRHQSTRTKETGETEDEETGEDEDLAKVKTLVRKQVSVLASGSDRTGRGLHSFTVERST